MKVPSKVDVKIVLLGRYYSGKTSLIQRFIYNTFEERYSNVSIKYLCPKSLHVFYLRILSKSHISIFYQNLHLFFLKPYSNLSNQ